MAWVTQRTWATSETITASQLNVMVRDDLRFLYSPPGVRVTHDGNQAVAVGTPLIVRFSLTLFDTDGMHAGVEYGFADPSAFLTVQTAGRYALTAGLEWEIEGGYGYNQAEIAKNAALTVIAAHSNTTPIAGARIAKAIDSFAVDEFVFARANQLVAPTTAINVRAIYPYTPSFSAHWMGN